MRWVGSRRNPSPPTSASTRPYRARLRGASLAKAWLFKADLRGVDLRGADLRKAVLREAIADLTTWRPDEHFDPKEHDVRVLGVSLRGARANAFTEWPEGFDWRQAGVIMEDEPRQANR
jgi:hypothetical protein